MKSENLFLVMSSKPSGLGGEKILYIEIELLAKVMNNFSRKIETREMVFELETSPFIVRPDAKFCGWT